ncbi:STAS-like domain-containing protein [Vibrio astriarenae]
MTTCLIDSINLAEQFDSLATRKTGRSARETLLDILDQTPHITLDFSNSPISPSFADELIGILARDIGLPAFKRRVKLVNVSSSSQTIIKHVLRKRLT